MANWVVGSDCNAILAKEDKTSRMRLKGGFVLWGNSGSDSPNRVK